MALTAAQVAAAVERAAPLELAEDWDNVGIQVGSPEAAVTGVSLALDPLPSAVTHAHQQGANLLLCHHPLIQSPISRLPASGYVPDTLRELLSHDMALYIAHTNADASPILSPTYALADLLCLGALRPLSARDQPLDYKVVVFVPTTHTHTVLQAMADAGAGGIGNYVSCSFRTSGLGTFRPTSQATPFVGEKEQLNEVQEERLEMVVPRALLPPVLSAMRTAHPYEEVAFDVYPRVTAGVGQGLVGELPEPQRVSGIAHGLSATLGAAASVWGDCNSVVKRAAVCAGSASSLVETVPADVKLLVAGEVNYHSVLALTERGTAVLTLGHFATERPFLDRVQSWLTKEFGDALSLSQCPIGPPGERRWGAGEEGKT